LSRLFRILCTTRAPEGRENHFHLAVGWSPDNRGGIAIYQARYATDTVAWINPAEHKTSDVWPQIEKAVRRVAVRKKGKEAADADYEIRVSNPVFVRPRRFVIDAVIGMLSSKKPDAPSYSFEILFDVKDNPDAPQLEVVSAKSVSDESGWDIGDNEIEARLNKAYHKLATILPPRDRESLKGEELKWLATREHIIAAEKDEKESIQLRLTERRVAELETRARYR
jgi:Lysozyme inhibitor LprI